MEKSLGAAVGLPSIASRDLALLLVMVLLWGVSWPAMKACLASVAPLWLATIRFASASASLFVVLALRGQVRLPARQDLPIVASIGLLQMMAFTALGLLAMTRIEAGHAALLAYTTPLWVTLASLTFLRQRVAPLQLVAVGVGLLGILVVCLPALTHWNAGVAEGDAMLLAAALCWAVVMLHVRRHRWRASPLQLAPWQMLLAALPLGLAACAFEGLPHIDGSLSLVALLVLIGPVATCLCFVISSEVGRRIPPLSISLATLGVPVAGLLASIVFLGEAASTPIVLGVTLIVSSMVVVVVMARP